METKDLLFIIEKFEQSIGNNFITSKYDELINAVTQRKPYQEIRVLIAEIADFNINNNFSDLYFFGQREVAQKLNLYELFGETANNILQEYLNDLDTAPKSIADFKQRIVELKNHLISIKQNLISVGLQVSEQEQNILEFVFDGKESIETIEDLQKRTRDLPRDIKGLARLANESGIDPKIIHISKNSPTVIQIILTSGTVLQVINHVVKEILDRILQVQEIKKNQLEIEKRGIENKKIKEGFIEEIEKVNTDFEKKLAEKLYEKYNPNSGSGAKNEVITAVQSAIKNLNGYIEKGGSINIKILPEPTEDGTVAQIHLGEIPMNKYALLQKNSEEIKQLESPKVNFETSVTGQE